MLKDPLFLIVLVAIAALVLLRKRIIPGPPVEVFTDPYYRPPAGPPTASTTAGNPWVQPTSTLIGGRGPEPFSADTLGSHYLSQFQTLRRN
jgi:hypothetical protein